VVDSQPNLNLRGAFKGLSAVEWESVVKHGRLVRRPAGTTVVREGEADRSVFAIKTGQVDVILHSPTGGSMTVGSRGPGQLVGEMAALDGEPRSASVIAATNVELILMSKDGFLEVLEKNPAMAIDLLTQASLRLRSLIKRHARRSNSLNMRIATRLLQFTEDSGSNKLNLTQDELASWVDATRESTSKELKILRDAGILRTARGSITVLDIDRLTELATP
jgi:CRP/FNR family cyclic AMP-dependent transcriptional regulator